MSTILNPHVLCYKVKMNGGYLYCNNFDRKKEEYIIGKFYSDDEYNLFFDHEVTVSFKCNNTNIIIESRKLFSRYAIIKNEFNKDIKLSKNVMYKISGNKIEPLI